MNNRTIRDSSLKALLERLPGNGKSIVLWKKLIGPVLAGFIFCLAQGASGQDAGPDWRWTGNAGDGLWGTVGNWEQGSGTTWQPATILPPTNCISVWLTGANGANTQTIAAGTEESPGIANDNSATFGNIFGPEFGGVLNIYGTLHYDWVLAAVDNAPNRPTRTQLNMYDDAVLTGTNLGIGTTWWFRAPNVVMNMYSNAQARVRDLWWGGHINIYDNAVLTATGTVQDQGTLELVSDATRNINLGGGQLVLPASFGATVTNWISRGILLAYGKRYATNEIAVDEQATNTIVNTVALGGDLERIYFEPVPSLMAGMYHQALLMGDFPGTSAVLSTPDSGVNPAMLPGSIDYASDNTNIVTVNSNGLLHAISPGNATVTASLGTFTSTNVLSVTVTPVVNTLIHRYSFNETSGMTAADSVGGSAWDGTLNGSASFSAGQLVLDGAGWVELPAGLVSNLDALTIEAWATFGPSINPQSALYSFGDLNASQGVNYVTMYPHTSATNAQANFGIGDPGSANLQSAVSAQTLDGLTEVQIVTVFYPLGGYISLYTNGVVAGTYNNVALPLNYQTVFHTNLLTSVLGADPWNIIGGSLYSADPLLNASIDELRIYDGPMTASQIQAHYAAGPDTLPVIVTRPTIMTSVSGNNLLISWTTNGTSGFKLQSTTTLGSGWNEMPGSPSVVGGNYQVSVPLTNTAQFFLLKQ